MLTYTCVAFEELSLEELYNFMALRLEVFAVEQNCPYQDADGKDQAAWHVMGKEEAGQIMAYARLIPQGVAYAEYVSIGRVVNHASMRGKGTGRALMEHSLQFIEALWPGQAIKISAQAYLVDFYTSLGFKAYGGTYLEDGIPHVEMRFSKG